MPYFLLGAGDTLTKRIVTEEWVDKALQRKMVKMMGLPDLGPHDVAAMLTLDLTVDARSTFSAKATLLTFDQYNRCLYNDREEQQQETFQSGSSRQYHWSPIYTPGTFIVLCFILEEEKYPRDYFKTSHYTCTLTAEDLGNWCKTATLHMPQS